MARPAGGLVTASVHGVLTACTAFLVQGCSNPFVSAPAAPEAHVPRDATGVIYVLRHGEKILAGNHLNRTGRMRARHVAGMFDGGPQARYDSPKAIFANFFNGEYNSVELATPLARRLGLRVNSSFHRPADSTDNSKAAAGIIGSLDENGGPVMAVWESWNMVPLVRDLGCDRPWMMAYDGYLWGHLANRMTAYDNFFILHLQNGECANVTLEREFFDSPRTWAHPPPVPEDGQNDRSWLLGDTPLVVFAAGLVLATTAVGALLMLGREKGCCRLRRTEGHERGPTAPLLAHTP